MMKAITSLMTAAAVSTVLSACAGTPEEAQVSCAGPDSRNLTLAVEQAKRLLAEPACASEFDNYFQQLLTVGEEDPAADNKRVYRDFIAWSHQQGLIGRQRGKTMYTRYFHRNFVSLPDDYNNCASICPDRATIEREMKGELFSKHRGSARILGDKDAYRQIDSDYNGVLLLLDATCQACEDGHET